MFLFVLQMEIIYTDQFLLVKIKRLGQPMDALGRLFFMNTIPADADKGFGIHIKHIFLNAGPTHTEKHITVIRIKNLLLALYTVVPGVVVGFDVTAVCISMDVMLYQTADQFTVNRYR
jgi:hypothetical protein